MKEFVFTFGFEHVHPVAGYSLARRYVVIHADTRFEARQKMAARFGTKWSFQYDSREAAGVRRFGLSELMEKDWPP